MSGRSRLLGPGAALVAALACAPPAQADTFNVPGDLPTVQAALDAADAAAGRDTISVAPGTYRENLRVNPQPVTITAPAGRSRTVLDASGEGESALRIIGGNVTVRGLTITGGTGTEYGGRRGGGVQIVPPAGGGTPTAVFEDCAISGNEALDANSIGGGVFVGSDSSATFTDCLIEANRAGDGGGGIFGSVGATITLNGGAIRDNRAGVRSTAGAGGGIEVADADVFVRGTTLSGNTSTFAGGAVHAINHLSQTERRLVMSDCAVTGNMTASGPASGGQDDQGGGIHVEDRVRLVMTGCTVSGNDADSGGGISSFRAHLSITDSVIAGNTAHNPTGVGGGGIMSIGAQTVLDGRCPAVTLTRTAVVGNVAAGKGGGILSSEGAGCSGDQSGVARLDLEQSTVSENVTQSARGGGVIAVNTDLVLSASHVNANDVEGAGGRGGGIVLSQGISTAAITDATIAANATPEAAAGIYVTGGGSPTLNMSDSRLYANRSDNPDPNFGGGLVVVLEGGTGRAADGAVSGNVIADNSSFQIAEQDFSRTDLVYSENEFGTSVPGEANRIYRSVGTAPNPAYDTASEFNAATLGAGDRTAGNLARAPDFTDFIATPGRFVAAAPGDAYLSWSAARADSVLLAGSSTPRPETDTVEVTGAACDEARAFELLVTRGGQQVTSRATVDGAPCVVGEPPGEPGACPAGTTASVTCSSDGRGRLVFAGTGADEVLVGSAGADVLNGGGGKDRLVGAKGKDSFSGGAGGDRINSKGQRRESVRCGGGNDRVRGAKADRLKRDCERVRR